MSQARPTDIEADTYARHFVQLGVKSDAFRVTFPKSKAADKAIHEKASTFHKIEKVQARISELNGIARKKANEVYGITAEWVASQMKNVIEMGQREIYDQHGNKKAENLSAVTSAGATLNKMCGFDAPTKVEHSGNVSGLTDEQAAILQKLTDDSY